MSLLESSSLRLDVFFTQLNISSTLATLLLGFVLGFACNVVVLSAIGVSPRFCSRARLPPSHPPTHARTHTRARSDPPHCADCMSKTKTHFILILMPSSPSPSSPSLLALPPRPPPSAMAATPAAGATRRGGTRVPPFPPSPSSI